MVDLVITCQDCINLTERIQRLNRALKFFGDTGDVLAELATSKELFEAEYRYHLHKISHEVEHDES